MKTPLWFTALGATLVMQINASMLDQAIAVLAPLLTAELGIRPQWVGAFSACSALGGKRCPRPLLSAGAGL